MADIRLLTHTVTTVVDHGGRVVLVGDQHQMPSIGAGGGFGYAAEHGRCVATLTVNRRQREMWEQEALRALRNGSVPQRSPPTTTTTGSSSPPDAATMVDEAIARWTAAIDAGQRPVMLAGSNDLVDRLNQAAIHVLVERGLLTDDDGDASYGGRRYRVGDRVALRRNSDRERTVDGDRVEVANGQLGTVVAVDGGRLTVRLDRQPDVDVVLDERYLARGGRVSHGYALTTHRAQGGTWDLSITVGADGLYREAAYTDLSRGIAENWLIVPDPDLARLLAEADPDLDRHDTGIDPDDGTDVDDDLIDRIVDVAGQAPRPQPRPRPSPTSTTSPAPDRSSTSKSASPSPAEPPASPPPNTASTATSSTDQLQAVEHTARHVALGVRVKALDRHNIGTVEAVDDTRGTVVVGFVSPDGREAAKELAWEQLRVIDRGVAIHDLSPDAEATVDRIRTRLHSRFEMWAATVIALGSHPGEVNLTARAINRHVAAHANQLAGDQPDWLDALIGPRPADPVGAGTWDSLVTDIARWRTRHQHSADGLGPVPADPDQQQQWHALTERLATTRSWLRHAGRHEPTWPVVRSRTELLARRQTLETILDTAPADTRPVIAAVRAGQLTLTDVDEILRHAGEQRDARNHWILQHWPHVVEYVEVTTTLTDHSWGPDADRLLGDIDPDDIGPHLDADIDAGASWLQPALCAIDATDDTPLSDAQIDWLNDVAEYRHTHRITGPRPARSNPHRTYRARRVRHPRQPPQPSPHRTNARTRRSRHRTLTRPSVVGGDGCC